MNGEWKTRKMLRSYPRSTWKRQKEACRQDQEAGGKRQHICRKVCWRCFLWYRSNLVQASHLSKTQTHVKLPLAFASLLHHLTLPVLFPDTALPRGFYDCLCKHMSILGCGYFCVSWFELAKQVFVIWVGVTQKAADAWSPVTDPQLGYGDGPHGQSLRSSMRPGTEKGQGTALTRVSQGARAWSKP